MGITCSVFSPRCFFFPNKLNQISSSFGTHFCFIHLLSLNFSVIFILIMFVLGIVCVLFANVSAFFCINSGVFLFFLQKKGFYISFLSNFVICYNVYYCLSGHFCIYYRSISDSILARNLNLWSEVSFIIQIILPILFGLNHLVK